MKGIDKIIWINSNNRPDRFRNMKERFSNLNINAERFPALYGGSVDWQDPKYSIFYKQGVLQELNNGEIGCFLSHRAIWEQIKENGWDKTLILEDDALFLEGFQETFDNIIERMPEYDMLYLGQWNYDIDVIHGETRALKEKVFDVPTRSIHKACRCWLTHAYIVDLKCVDKLINNSKNIYASVDRVLADIQENENLNVYAVYPNLINQDMTKSSLRNL